MIDRTLLSKGEEFEDLVDTYVIFITENDKYGEGIPLYHIERKITDWWKVRNRGRHAETRNQIRGQIEKNIGLRKQKIQNLVPNIM